jgi:hypothetical protein
VSSHQRLRPSQLLTQYLCTLLQEMHDGKEQQHVAKGPAEAQQLQQALSTVQLQLQQAREQLVAAATERDMLKQAVQVSSTDWSDSMPAACLPMQLHMVHDTAGFSTIAYASITCAWYIDSAAQLWMVCHVQYRIGSFAQSADRAVT